METIDKTVVLIFALYATYQQITNDVLAIKRGGYNDKNKSRISTAKSAITAILWGIFYYLNT